MRAGLGAAPARAEAGLAQPAGVQRHHVLGGAPSVLGGGLQQAAGPGARARHRHGRVGLARGHHGARDALRDLRVAADVLRRRGGVPVDRLLPSQGQPRQVQGDTAGRPKVPLVLGGAPLAPSLAPRQQAPPPPRAPRRRRRRWRRRGVVGRRPRGRRRQRRRALPHEGLADVAEEPRRRHLGHTAAAAVHDAADSTRHAPR